MPITTTHCHILGSNVTRVTDLEGNVIRVICPEYLEPGGTCRRRTQAQEGGPLSRLIERVEEGALADRGVRCQLH